MAFAIPGRVCGVSEQPNTEAPEDVDAPSERPTFGRRVLGWLGEGAIIVVGAIVIAVLLRTFIGQMFVIPSGSMQNTIDVGDRVFVGKLGGFQRGDVVVFEDPDHWLGTTQTADPGPLQRGLEFVGLVPTSGTEHLIKRVIGMPGDHVRLNDEGKIEVNGQALDETPYLFAENGVQVEPATVPFDIVVPAGHIFVMGDHRNASGDSRCRLANVKQGEPQGMAAFIPVDKVVGSAVAIVAPLDRLSTFVVPETFASVPDPAEPAPDKPVLHHVEPGC